MGARAGIGPGQRAERQQADHEPEVGPAVGHPNQAADLIIAGPAAGPRPRGAPLRVERVGRRDLTQAAGAARTPDGPGGVSPGLAETPGRTDRRGEGAVNLEGMAHGPRPPKPEPGPRPRPGSRRRPPPAFRLPVVTRRMTRRRTRTAAPGASLRGARRPRAAGAADRPTGSSFPPAVLAARAGPGPA